MYCPKCGTQNANDALTCVSCGYAFTGAAPVDSPVEVRRSGLAVAAFVLGILSFITLSLTAIPAMILGIIALITIGTSGGRRTGTALAVLGIVLPVLSVVVTLMVILMPALSRVRAQAMRVQCMSHLRELSMAWYLYASDNDGRVVNGAAGSDRAGAGGGFETAWTGMDWAAGYKIGEQLPRHEQESAIRHGLLFPYCAAIEPYRCPAGRAGQLRTYAIVDAMNGAPREGTEERGVYVKQLFGISGAATRAVFIDQGWAGPGSFPVHYAKPEWWCAPPLTHRDGTAVAFGDGHVEPWRWEAPETRKIARRPDDDYGPEHVAPQTREGKDDLKKFQTAVWGQVDYAPVP